MTLEEAVSRSAALIHWKDAQLEGPDVPSTVRARLAAGCLDTALEHHKAIVLLVANKLYGSAFALVRLLFEAYVRGVWLHRCASDAEVEQFKKGHVKKFQPLLDDVEKLDGFEAGVLSDAKRKSWKGMNEYTHSGYAQAVRRNTETTIEPNYDEAEVVEALSFANAAGFLSIIAIADLANNVGLALRALEKASEFAHEPQHALHRTHPFKETI